MNCKDVARALSEDSRLPLQAQDHVRSRDRCQELVRSLDSAIPVDLPSAANLQQIAAGMTTNLRPVRPVAPAQYFLGAFLGIFVSIVALSIYRMGSFAIAVMTPLQTATVLSALAISSGLLAYSLVDQMVPGGRHRIAPSLLPVGITISLTIAIAVLFQFQHEQNFWRNAWACIRAGTPIGILAAVPFWLLRRGAVLSPSMTGAATGLLAGWLGLVCWRFSALTWMHGTFWYRTSALRCCARWSVLSPGWRSKSSVDVRFIAVTKNIEYQQLPLRRNEKEMR
jgi:hypothetical protein